MKAHAPPLAQGFDDHSFDPESMTINATATPAAPARARIRIVAVCVAVVFLALTARAAQLAFVGPPEESAAQTRSAATSLARAQVTDRNGVLLIGQGVAYVLVARPSEVTDPQEATRAIARLLPGLDEATILSRVTASQGERFVRRGLTREQLDSVLDLGLPGLFGQEEPRRNYPNGTLAGQLLGFTNIDLIPQAGIERGLDQAIRSNDRLALSLDVRLQYALEAELSAGAQAAGATAASGLLVDGATGEILAMATWPAFNPNRPGGSTGRNLAVAGRYELGSVLKPFTLAMALDAGVVMPNERFDVSRPLRVGDRTFEDDEPADGPLDITGVLARSSNIAAGNAALRVGLSAQSTYLARLGFDARPDIGLPEAVPPSLPTPDGPVEVASRGFGYAMSASPLALAGAYTVFVNRGERIGLTLRPRAPENAPPRTRVFSAAAADTILQAMTRALPQGTGRRAVLPGLEIAGKTGTSRLLDDNGDYVEGRVLASFAAVFPAQAPRYVLALVVEQPQRGLSPGAGATGGGVAAPIAGHAIARFAPFLGLHTAPTQAQNAPLP
ncbi:MAG: peptidoglycan D,D-transpeptidase FtsI family protein [Caulobacterales bacterium]|jgi:cell division protein FtsI (penicillin-binding protein 3)